MVAKHHIVLREWNYNCGDGCCTDYGTDLIINDVEIDRYFYHGYDMLEAIIKALGITDFEVEVIDDTTNYTYWNDYDEIELEEEDDDDAE